MKRAIIALMMLAGAVQAQDYVVASRPYLFTNGLERSGYELSDVSMPLNLWTNATFLLNAKMPILNEGTTNAAWLGWGPVKQDATQLVIASQPARAYTNSNWVLRFDGTDDFLTGSSTSTGAGTPWTVIFTGRINRTASVNILIGASSGNEGLWVHNDRFYHRNASGTLISGTKTTASVQDREVAIKWAYGGASNIAIYVDGALYDNIDTTTNAVSLKPLRIFSYGSADFTQGHIKTLHIFKGVQ